MTTIAEEARHYILTVACASARGQVAALSGFLDERGCYIREFAQFDDATTHRFFARCLFRADPQSTPPLERLRREFAAGPAARWDMEWALHDTSVRPCVLIAVSKFDHCLNDLLYRHRIGELRMDVPAVVSKHPDLEPLARRHGIPFVHLPVTPDTKAAQEARLWEVIEETGSELVVLARYMQVVSDALCGRLRGRAINIHHSFLRCSNLRPSAAGPNQPSYSSGAGPTGMPSWMGRRQRSSLPEARRGSTGGDASRGTAPSAAFA